MHPAYKKLSCLDKVVRSLTSSQTSLAQEQAIFEVKDSVHEKILALANRAYANVHQTQGVVRSILNITDDEAFELDNMADAFSVASITDFGVHETVKFNFRNYMKEKVQPNRAAQSQILTWWKENSARFPYISDAARCLLGSLPSASAVEIDNGVAGMFLPKSRLSTSTQIVEMKLFVKRNAKFLNWNEILQIEEENLEIHFPPKPKLPFVEQCIDEDDCDEPENFEL